MRNSALKEVPVTEENQECAKICLETFRKWERREITSEEYRKEVAYIAVDFTLDDLKFRHFNVSIPKELEKYYSIAEHERNASRSFWDRTDIKSYMDAKSDYKCSMVSNCRWLRELRSRFSGYGDKENSIKVDRVSRMYPENFRRMAEDN